MPHEICWERPFGVRGNYSGEVTPDAVTRVNDTITSDAGFDDLRYIIVDLLGATSHRFDAHNQAPEFDVSYATLIGASYSNPHIHMAYLVTHPAIEALVEVKIARGVLPYPARVFATESAARDWLGAMSVSLRRPNLL